MTTTILQEYARDMLAEFLGGLRRYNGSGLNNIKSDMVSYDFLVRLDDIFNDIYDKVDVISEDGLDALLDDFSIEQFARVLYECNWLSYEVIGMAIIYWVAASDARKEARTE